MTGGAAGALRAERSAVNLIDAAAEGAIAGLRLAGYVGALLIAFVALIAMVNGGRRRARRRSSASQELTLQRVLGFALRAARAG